MSEQDVPDLFDTDNVIVCQYDKVLCPLLDFGFINCINSRKVCKMRGNMKVSSSYS